MYLTLYGVEIRLSKKFFNPLARNPLAKRKPNSEREAEYD